MALLAAILDGQVERVPAGVIEERRIVEALTTGPGFRPDERRQLWLSPAARNTYFSVKERLRRELEERLSAAHVELRVVPLVAHGGAQALTVDGKDFTVVMQDYTQEAGEWVISLRLKSRLREQLYPMTVGRLVDSEGLEWLSGRPGSRGEINSTWRHERISPRDRLKYALEFVLE